MNKTIVSTFVLFAVISSLVSFNSCSNNSGSDNPISPNTTRRDGVTELSYIRTLLRIGGVQDNSGVLWLDTVKLLMKDIKLNVANSNEQRNFKVGPYVIYLFRQNTPVYTLGSEYIPDGTYDKVIFKIHKLDPNEPVPDPDFVDGNHRYSVVAKGTYDGNYFMFRSDKTVVQQLSFPNSLVVNGSYSNITLSVQPYDWFRNDAGEYMDPNDPNNSNEIEHNIRDNIRHNFRAFQDNDKDGRPD